MSRSSGRNGKRAGAIFLDRDGVINACPRGRYVTHWEQFRFLPGVLGALRALNAHRRLVLVVSNQSGVGRGLFSDGNLKTITDRMLEEIRRSGGKIGAVYYCTHPPEARCGCRKPRSAMLRRAARRFSIDLKQSYVIGDSETDVRMGRSAGCTTLQVLSGRYSRAKARRLPVQPDRIVRDLAQAVRWILRQQGKGVG